MFFGAGLWNKYMAKVAQILVFFGLLCAAQAGGSLLNVFISSISHALLVSEATC